MVSREDTQVVRSNALTAESPEWWHMLVFTDTANAARFVKDLHSKIGDLKHDEVRVGINAVNVAKTLFAQISGEFSGEEYKYTVNAL